mmetsp:Transcript_14230/g.32304  ORF Transcript_14230/g.32304 Transcript_14230/m.32304 type:complete len:578 (-) Transcript_14230:4-1737(-)
MRSVMLAALLAMSLKASAAYELQIRDAAAVNGVCKEEAAKPVCECNHRKSFRVSVCSECKDKSKWGYGCDLECPSMCKLGCSFIGDCLVPESCQKSSRVAAPLSYKLDKRLNERGECESCSQREPPGYWGLWCEHRCPANCKESSAEGFCTRVGHCFSCLEGHYGPDCALRCAPSCRSCVMRDNMVPIAGTDDFWPAGACEEPDCQGNRWGLHCNETCPTNCKQGRTPTCLRENGHCMQCEAHLWWGDRCEKPAPEGCQTRAGRYPKGVEQRTGVCELGCKHGYYGESCEHSCSQNCLDGCTNGICTKGCHEGFWGETCNSTCPRYSSRGCDQQTGMPFECDEGYYPGYTALEVPDDSTGEPACVKCSDTCKTHGGTSICDKNGHCTQGCMKGFHGPECKAQCPPRCSGPCDRIGTGKWDGYCTACLRGFSGESCNEVCNSTCMSCEKLDRNRCTSCRSEEPVELESGRCVCIAGATRGNPAERRCSCKPSGTGKIAAFDPTQGTCRDECKAPHYEKVWSLGSSLCISKALYNAVVKASIHDIVMEKGDCNDDEYQIYEAGRPECLHREAVEYILRE